MNTHEKKQVVLDNMHVGDIRGAMGTIRHGDTAARNGLWPKFKTLLAVLGPGLIVMVGDNDAGAFSTYTQVGQNYGTSLLWTLLLLIPVLYVNQEMALRLGCVTGVGHGRLILDRFGKFWGAFSVIDLFLLNALTIVTEFIGITLALGYLGLPKEIGVIAAALLIMASASTGSFRRFERFALILCAGSLVLIPIYFIINPPIAQIVHDTLVPQLPHGAKLNDVMLLIIAIVGTTVAPWQLFFQQSYVIDKRLTPRFIPYERADLWIGIGIVIIGAIAMIAFTAHAFAHHPEFGNFTDAGMVAVGLEKYYGRLPGVLFAVALLDASVIGAMAISLSTAYAIGDVLSLNHSLHRKPSEAKEFYFVYCGLIIVAAALMIIPGVPLGLLTNAVQALAGVLLPSATVFLLLLCNDKVVLGPWVNGRIVNIFTGIVLAVLVILSIVLTASVFWPDMSERILLTIISVCTFLALAGGIIAWKMRARKIEIRVPIDGTERDEWRMPPLAELPPMQMSRAEKLWMTVLRSYLVVAGGMVLYHIAQLALSGGH